MEDFYKELGHNIAIQRVAHGLSQKDFADKMSLETGRIVSAATVSAWENGHRRIPADVLHKISSVIGCSSYFIFPHSKVYSSKDMLLLEYIKSLPDRDKETLLYMSEDWKGDPRAFWEFGRLYAVLPEYRRELIARTGIEVYKEAVAEDDPEIDQDIDVDLKKIIRAWKKLEKDGLV